MRLSLIKTITLLSNNRETVSITIIRTLSMAVNVWPGAPPFFGSGDPSASVSGRQPKSGRGVDKKETRVSGSGRVSLSGVLND